MTTTSVYAIEANNYWRLIKDASTEVKLRLITLLSQSMSANAKEEDRSDKDTDAFVNKFFGIWRDDESFNDMMDAIRENRTSRPPISLD